MGVCALQHRISTGLNNTHNVLVSRGTRNRDIRSKYGVMYYFACAAGLILYLYILCLLMALHVNSLNKNSVQFYTAGVNPTERVISFEGNLYVCFLIVIINLGKRKRISIFGRIFVHIFRKFNRKNIFSALKIVNYITLWITALNLILIVICCPSIKTLALNPNYQSFIKMWEALSRQQSWVYQIRC